MKVRLLAFTGGTMNNELKRKIGQMFMCGFDSREINDHIERLINEYYLGNVILFTRNLESKEQIKQLNNNLSNVIKEKTGYNPLISIDEEGGSVSRMRNILGEFLGHYAIGALNDKDIARQIGVNVGNSLYELGINMNLAPVADINSNSKNIGIGIRSFGANTEVVKNMAVSMAKGYEESNILPTLKHFPGLGDLSEDSHYDLPVINKRIEELEAQELAPFKYGIDNGIKSIMVGHVIINALDKEYPATLSKAVITDYLINKLGYKGLIMTDCFEMGAIQKHYGTGEACVIAINAGVDIFDISHTESLQSEAIEAVYRAVESGRITEERIEVSYRKIVEYKKLAEQNINKSKVTDCLSFEDMYLKLLKSNDVESQNINKENTIALAVKHFGSNLAEDVIHNPVNIGDLFENKSGIKSINFEKDLSTNDIDDLVTETQNYENVILFLGDMDIYPMQHELYNKLVNKNIYLVDMRLKVDSLKVQPKMYFNAYSYTNKSVEVLNDYLCSNVF